MPERRPRKRREIFPPIRRWLPLSQQDENASDTDEADESSHLLPVEERGLAGADDIVQWLSILMNERGVSYDKLSELSGVPTRTIKNWFNHNQDNRKIPNLRTIQACFEALGQSLIVGRASIFLNNGDHYYPIMSFRQELLESSLEQRARIAGLSVDEFIERSEAEYHETAQEGLAGPRRRDT
jgi:transcriptional regulator with XRE-family HTH domain